MSDALISFMVDLASDPDRVARFVENPASELHGVELTPRERSAVLSRSQLRIRRELRLSVGNLMTRVSFKFKKKRPPVKKKPARRTKTKKPAARRRNR